MLEVLKGVWNKVLYQPILNMLVLFYHFCGDNLGLAIIAITIVIKLASYPLNKPSMEAARKQRELQPELAKLKKKYKDKQVYAKKQMELFKENGINPAAGCLPQILQLLVFFALYSVFGSLLNDSGTVIDDVNALLYNWDYLYFETTAQINTQFLYLDLAKPDPIYLLPVIAAASQFVLSKYIMKPSSQAEEVAKETPEKTDDMMVNMQQQMTYIMPIITLVIGVNLPSGLVLYWFVSTLLTIVQYLVFNKRYDIKNDNNK